MDVRPVGAAGRSSWPMPRGSGKGTSVTDSPRVAERNTMLWAWLAIGLLALMAWGGAGAQAAGLALPDALFFAGGVLVILAHFGFRRVALDDSILREDLKDRFP